MLGLPHGIDRDLVAVELPGTRPVVAAGHEPEIAVLVERDGGLGPGDGAHDRVPGRARSRSPTRRRAARRRRWPGSAARCRRPRASSRSSSLSTSALETAAARRSRRARRASTSPRTPIWVTARTPNSMLSSSPIDTRPRYVLHGPRPCTVSVLEGDRDAPVARVDRRGCCSVASSSHSWASRSCCNDGNPSVATRESTSSSQPHAVATHASTTATAMARTALIS